MCETWSEREKHLLLETRFDEIQRGWNWDENEGRIGILKIPEKFRIQEAQ